MWFRSCGSFETVMNLNWAGEATVSPAFSFNRAPYSQALAAWTQWSELSLYSDVNKLSGASRLTTTTTCLILSFHSHTNSFIHAVSQCYTATLAQWAWDKPYSRRLSPGYETHVLLVWHPHHLPMFLKTSEVELEVNCGLCFATDVLFHYSRARNSNFASD